MKGKLVLLGMLIVFILALAFSQSQPAQAEVTETFVGLKGADIWDKPPGMGGSVVGHLPFLFDKIADIKYIFPFSFLISLPKMAEA